ncbi:MAG: DNA polymerase III subunit alpha [Gammaproteobacteria bacterium]
MTNTFVHLHLHTEYSLVDGVVRIKPLVSSVAESGMPAVALTDQSNLFAMVKFYRAAMAAGVKPIIGSDLWIRNDKQLAKPHRLVLLCQNHAGYLNLTRLISKSYLEGQYQSVPMLDEAWLAGATEGLIALSGGVPGALGRALLAGDEAETDRHCVLMADLFPDRYYLEIQRTGSSDEEIYNKAAVALASVRGLPLVATNNVRFLQQEEFEAHEARVCIHQGRTLDDPRRSRDYTEQQYLRSPAEMHELFKDIPEALENTVEIAKRCNLELELGKNYLPDFPIPDGILMDDYFSDESRKGLKKRLEVILDQNAADYEEQRASYDERLKIELKVIIDMGFPGYFLIVADFIHWAKTHGVPVGPGRGSGAGSLVAYALSITDLDPIEYDLLFERFLNPERVSMPDFDIDFCMEGRDRVIDYVARKYGREKVSQIITYGSMAAKAVVRDVGRVLGHPYGFVDRIAKLVPFEIGITLTKALQQEEALGQLYREDEEVGGLIDLALSLEGLARNAGKHAGGVVISPTRLTDFTPVYCEENGANVVSQFDKDDVEAVGLVKFDFLGLRTLTIVDWALQTINAKRQAAEKPVIEILQIPLDDSKAFDLLKAYQTTAVFQLESRGMKDLIKRLQPDSFEDIIALVALFRPGPLQSGMVDDFIERKHGRQKVVYPHPDLEPILSPTYGVILYQEQVMQIAQVLAGYSLGGADLLRRAMGKKKPEEMAKQRGIFTQGSLERGVEEKTATYIFDLMEKFAGYGFNKSHSAAYALISYQTAWLKAHYPAAFMAAVLSADMDNTDKIVLLIDDCRSMNIPVLSPDVNQSGYAFTVRDENTILYGMGAIKGVGESVIGAIIEERNHQGLYRSLIELCRRTQEHKVTRRVYEAMIRSGALDSLGSNRASLMLQLPDAIRSAEQHVRDSKAGQTDLFGGATPVAEEQPETLSVAEWDDEQWMADEKATLGLYLTKHPIDRYQEELSYMVTECLAKMCDDDAVANAPKGRGREKTVVVAGLSVETRVRPTKSGNKIAYLTLDDKSARMEISVFTKVYSQYEALVVNDKLLVVEGKLGIDDYSGNLRLSAEHIYDIDQAREVYAKCLELDLQAPDFAQGLLQSLESTLKPFCSGHCPVGLSYLTPTAKTRISLGDEWAVHPTNELLNRLRSLAGEKNVRVIYN